MGGGKTITQLIFPMGLALIGYLFSLHVDFINVKAKVNEHDRSFELILKKLDKIESIVWNIHKKNN